MDEDMINTLFPLEKNGIRKPDLSALTAYLRAKYSPLTFNEKLYVYDSHTGLYHLDKGDISTEIQALVDAANYNKELVSLKRELRSRIIDTRVFQRYPFNSYPGIPFRNCVVVFDEDYIQKAVEYSDDMLFTHQIDTEYNPSIAYDNIWDILGSWVEPEYKEVLLQIPAQALLQAFPDNSPMKKVYLLHGQPDCGKTSYINLLKCVFGKSNCSGTSLQDLGKTFGLSSLFEMFMNLSDELPITTITDPSTINRVSGSDSAEVNQKYQNPVTLPLSAVHVFSCNSFPMLSQSTKENSGWWSRWFVIDFPYQHDKNNLWEKEHFTEENKSAFMNLVLGEFVKMQKNGGKLSLEQSPKSIMDRWIPNSSPLEKFFADSIRFERGSTIEKNQFMDIFLNWLDEYDGPEKETWMKQAPKTITALTQMLTESGYDIEETRVRSKNSPDVRCYTGIGWKKEVLI